MSTSRDDDPNNKPVTGYPYPSQPSNTYPPPQSNGYPPAQTNYHQQSNTGTGYPYTAPPPANYYNNNPNPNPYYQQQPYDARRATFLRRLIIAMISVFILFGAITFIIWLVLRPRLPEFQVQSVSVTGFNASSSQFSSNWDVKYLVRNPNKKLTIYYDRVEGSVYYRREFLTQNAIAPFVQGTRNETTLEGKFASVATYVDGGFINEMTSEKNRGTVNFNLRVLGFIRFKSGSWRTRLHLMRVFCDDITVGFSGSSGVGNLTGGPKKCNVDL